jgi:hypothetical protein
LDIGCGLGRARNKSILGIIERKYLTARRAGVAQGLSALPALQLQWLEWGNYIMLFLLISSNILLFIGSIN